jgi:hypothetical protein
MAPNTHAGALAPDPAALERTHERDRAELRPPGVAAAPPDVDAPQAGSNGEGRGKGQDKVQADCGSCGVDRKVEATLIAMAAIAGFELTKLADGSWLAQRWGLLKALPDARAVQAWLAKVGAE